MKQDDREGRHGKRDIDGYSALGQVYNKATHQALRHDLEGLYQAPYNNQSSVKRSVLLRVL